MKLKRFIFFFLVIIFLALLLLLNYYLKNNNLLFYATGTEEKAFLNATWRMSPKEIERANNTKLTQTWNVFMLTGNGGDYDYLYPQVVRMDRYVALKQIDHVNLWGFRTRVTYAFFDNKLFEYTLYINSLNSNELHDKIFSELKKNFGHESVEQDETSLPSMKWETDTVKTRYWLLNKTEKGYQHEVFLAGIQITYKPMLKEIMKVSLDEQRKIF